MVRAVDIKYKASGPLKDIVGSKAMTRGQIVKKVWAHIKKEGMQGEPGETYKSKGRTFKGGQIIYCDSDEMYDMCGRDKIGMTELATHMEKHIKRA